MDRSRTPLRALSSSLAAALALALSAPALAQSAPGGDFRDFKLPPKPSSSPVVGPVDGDTPAPRRATPTPAPIATVAPPPPTSQTTAQPAPTPSRQAQPQPQPRATAPAATQVPATSAASPAPVAVPTTSSGSLFPSAPGTSAAAIPPDASARVIEEDSGDGLWWLWPLLAAGLAGLAGLGWMLWRRRAKAVPAEPEFVRPRVPVAEPAADATPDGPEPVAAAEPLPAPAFAASQPGLAVTLDVTRMSATLVNATLSYRLKVANTGTLPLADVTIAGDMVSAHASVPNAEMLGADGAAMPELHRITALAPGESKVLTGDIRLPLAAIIPIQRGDARLFVPLARFRSTGTCAGVPVVAHSAFLVGQEPEARAKLQPFRLDLGPRMYSQVGQRPIVVAA